ncbi:DnaJ domain-containing protein [Flavobacteriales bacterium]|nr:DnaJ domain-containing protein [Flavobacteriales bacterium]
MKDYYQILAIPINSNEIEIKQAYRKGAMFWHPDKNNSSNAKEKFIDIQEAYEILSNKEKRRTYDELLRYKKNSVIVKNSDDFKQKESKNTKAKENNKEFQKFEEWISEIRRNAERKAKMPFVDDILTESFHFLDKYLWVIIMCFLLIFMLIAFSL